MKPISGITNWVVLIVTIPVPSIGVLVGMIVWPESNWGRFFFIASKLWFFGVPLIWTAVFQNGWVSETNVKRIGTKVGILTGIALSGVIILAFFLLGDSLIRKNFLAGKMSQVGLDTPFLFMLGALYWIFINSFLEEYAWRWFYFSRIRTFFPALVSAGIGSIFFTLHHAIALASFLPPMAALICSLGVFSGGLIWSILYIRYESIWPGWISHSIVDACIFAIGAFLIFK